MASNLDIFDCTKKFKFDISNTGEYLEDEYRETESNKYIGRMIGRNTFASHKKYTFTSGDIMNQALLEKKGSYVHNWKKRYFILRRDIYHLCYYTSRSNDLTLLGSIPLTKNTRVSSKQLGKKEYVLLVENEPSGIAIKNFINQLIDE